MEQKTAYAYHPETGEYLGEVNSWRSPLPDEKKERDFILPANATFKAPPKPEDGKIRVWDNGKEKWTFETAPAPEKKDNGTRTSEQMASSIRYQRNTLLAGTDWTQIADAPQKVVDNGTAWREYRQALRDIPQAKGFPESFNEWPVVPDQK